MAKKLEWFRNTITGGDEPEKMCEEDDMNENDGLKTKDVYSIDDLHKLVDL